MNAVQMLTEDHEKVRGLFQQFQSAGGAQQQIAQQVFTELDVHAAIEEEIFYPAMRTQADAQGKEMVAEAYEEHAQVKAMIGELRGMNAGDAQFAARFQELQQNVEHHAHEEESEMFPQAQELLGNQLDRLGEQMMQRKQQLMSTMQSMR